MSGGTYFTLFVSEQGRLFGCGNRFLKEIKIDLAEFRIVKIDLPEGMIPLKAFSSVAKK